MFQTLTVIEYLISNGSNRAVGEIIDQGFQIFVSYYVSHLQKNCRKTKNQSKTLTLILCWCFVSIMKSILGLCCSEPNGKVGRDVGMDVEKKAKKILCLLNDREKIKQLRNKAFTNRDKLVYWLNFFNCLVHFSTITLFCYKLIKFTECLSLIFIS